MCTIDGRNADPFFPAVMTGRHRIALTLGGPPADRGRVTPLSGDVPVMPGAPDVTWTSEREARITPAPPVSGSMAAATTSMVYLNAVPEEEIYRSTYTLYEAQQLIGNVCHVWRQLHYQRLVIDLSHSPHHACSPLACHA